MWSLTAALRNLSLTGKAAALSSVSVPGVAVLWSALETVPAQVGQTTGVSVNVLLTAIAVLWGVITAGFGLLWKEKGNYASRLETQLDRETAKKDDQLGRMVDGVTRIAESQNKVIDALERMERRMETLPKARSS